MADLKKTLTTLQALAYRKRYRKLDFFTPYPKQQQFYMLGATKRERLLMAANQSGKSYCGSMEAAYHLTGLYPDDWEGRRFTKAVTGIAAGESSLIVRKVQQKYLCGEPGVEPLFGTGSIPKDLFADKPSLSRGVTDAYDTIQVKHVTGGISVLHFMSYEQGRQKFQGDTADFVWFDEEPPEEIYSEGLTRTVATGGLTFMTFTPLLGRSKVVKRFTDEKSPDRAIVQMTIDDAEHMTPEMKRAALAGYLAHERDARAKGVPMLGSGAIFQAAEGSISEPAVRDIPPEWFKLWGLDFGIGHPFAAVLILWDKDQDCIHVHHAIRMQGEGATFTPLQHAVPMKAVAAAVPVAWPQDGTAREKSGETVAQLYKKQGLLMLPDHATWPDGGIGTEAGILEMDERMVTGRFKVASHLSQWFEEYRMYHRKDGLIVKIDDDLMSATRIAVMMKRFARQVQLGGSANLRKPRSYIVAGTDPDAF